jgi:CMP-N-acetylneuraminic acid synthetase
MKRKKTVAIIPIKSISKRVKGKNFIKIHGKPLYRYLLDKLTHSNFDEIYVDSDSDVLEDYCRKKKYNFIRRLPHLAKDNANGNDLLKYHEQIINSDYYFQLFVTAPLLSIKSINACIKILKTKNNYDSILTINKIFSWFWFNNKPINYKPHILPRSQDAKPMIQETTGLYGISKQSLRKNKCRIGKKPYFYQVSDEENIDLDNKKDFQYLKFILKK